MRLNTEIFLIVLALLPIWDYQDFNAMSKIRLSNWLVEEKQKRQIESLKQVINQ